MLIWKESRTNEGYHACLLSRANVKLGVSRSDHTFLKVKTPLESKAQLNSARLQRFAAILAASLTMSWVGIWNGFPLLYPDSMTYLDDGRLVARAIFLNHRSAYYGIRSFFYSLVILPLHWNTNPWPIVALQAMLVAWLLWLTVRSLLPQHAVASYLGITCVLSLLTTLSWYVPLILPDILGPVLYLAIYLLVFAPESISRRERWALYLVAWWCITSHATHLMLSAGLCALLAIVALLFRNTRRERLKSIVEVFAVVLVSAASQLALNAYLYGHPSLNGERPPFLAARIVADGPGRMYLAQHCHEHDWVICKHIDKVSSDPDNFLWGSDGLWPSLSEDEGAQLIKEEMPFVIATLRAYPKEEFLRAVRSVWEQLGIFGLNDLDPSGYTLSQFDPVIPAAKPAYLRSRQGRNIIPLDEITSFQFWIVAASLAILVAFTPWLWRRRPSRLLGLTLIIVSIELANAAVTSTLSMVEDRFQARVIWLLPFLAGLMMLKWWTGRASSSTAEASR
jgi:hypothetical protein